MEVIMKSELKIFSRYNTVAMQRLYDLLSGVPADLLLKEKGSFFGSIMGILNHLLSSDLNWFKRFHEGFPELKSLSSFDLSQNVIPGTKRLLYTELAPLRLRHETTTRAYSALIDEADEDFFAREFSYVNMKGDKNVAVVGHVLFHLFNHQTHHRGAIAQILDEEGIENDFSGLLTTIK